MRFWACCGNIWLCEKENIDILVENAVEINENPDREAFAALCQPVYDVFNDQMGTDEYLKMVQDFVATLRWWLKDGCCKWITY